MAARLCGALLAVFLVILVVQHGQFMETSSSHHHTGLHKPLLTPKEKAAIEEEEQTVIRIILFRKNETAEYPYQTVQVNTHYSDILAFKEDIKKQLKAMAEGDNEKLYKIGHGTVYQKIVGAQFHNGMCRGGQAGNIKKLIMKTSKEIQCLHSTKPTTHQ
uniref:Uncharacterized protein n=1 Tax=Ditylenchus dipsaci TaxID=166011 RepID=A0A915DKC7_9BILA